MYASIKTTMCICKRDEKFGKIPIHISLEMTVISLFLPSTKFMNPADTA